MQLDRYAVRSDGWHEMYEFSSVGVMTSIKKVVQYQQISPGIYNLAFGDWEASAQRIADSIRSNNGDRDKVLATVAMTVIDFINHHPEATVFVQGSTPARTRLYQIGINANWHQIGEIFNVQGFGSGEWERFQRNRNYEAFLLKAK